MLVFTDVSGCFMPVDIERGAVGLRVNFIPFLIFASIVFSGFESPAKKYHPLKSSFRTIPYSPLPDNVSENIGDRIEHMTHQC